MVNWSTCWLIKQHLGATRPIIYILAPIWCTTVSQVLSVELQHIIHIELHFVTTVPLCTSWIQLIWLNSACRIKWWTTTKKCIYGMRGVNNQTRGSEKQLSEWPVIQDHRSIVGATTTSSCYWTVAIYAHGRQKSLKWPPDQGNHPNHN